MAASEKRGPSKDRDPWMSAVCVFTATALFFACAFVAASLVMVAYTDPGGRFHIELWSGAFNVVVYGPAEYAYRRETMVPGWSFSPSVGANPWPIRSMWMGRPGGFAMHLILWMPAVAFGVLAALAAAMRRRARSR